MKQILIIAAILISLFGNAQKTIIDEKFVDGENPVGYRLKKNTLYISKGEQVKMRSISKITKVESYAANGDKKRLFEGESFRYFFPSYQIDDLFMGVEYSVNGIADIKYFVKGTPISIKEEEFRKDRNVKDINGFLNFTDKYLFALTNQNSKKKIDFSKDDLCLETMDIKSKSISRNKLEKPDISRLKGANFIQPKHNIGFEFRIKKDNTVEMITKSISNDYKSSVLYRTFYNQQGKKISETSYKIEIPDYFLVYSNNAGGEVDFMSKTEPFQDDSSIHNFIENDNGDIYVYGLFSKESVKLNDRINAAGYYVFKFDKKGAQVWKSINVIDDKKGFNNNHYPVNTKVDVLRLNKKLLFKSDINDNDEFIQYAILDETTGKILNSNKIVYHQEMNKNLYNQFIVSAMEIPSIKEDRNFNVNAIVAFDMNKEVENYIRSVKSKKDLQFEAIFSEADIWLIETDNKEYYKVFLFEDKI